MPNFANILLEKSGAVGTIILNRPKELNPLDDGMVSDLHKAFDDIDADNAIELIVLRGAGRSLSAGGDLKKALTLHTSYEWMSKLGNNLRGLLARIESSDKIVIAIVDGLCVAGGIELILGCDYVIATEDAKLSDGHLNFSLLPGAGGTQRMPRALGVLRAKDLLFSARFFSGKDAADYGLATFAVPADQLEAKIKELTDMLLTRSFSSRKAVKYLVNQGLKGTLAEGIHLEANYVLHYETMHPDAHEGLLAFSEKRKPNFSKRS